jgi:hypothetical protein
MTAYYNHEKDRFEYTRSTFATLGKLLNVNIADKEFYKKFDEGELEYRRLKTLFNVCINKLNEKEITDEQKQSYQNQLQETITKLSSITKPKAKKVINIKCRVVQFDNNLSIIVPAYKKEISKLNKLGY